MTTPKKTNGHLELVTNSAGKALHSPGVLKHIQDDALAACEQLLGHMFSATDDLFYELSKRATSNNEQNLYFESMREIRIKKEGLSKAFLRKISENFHSMLTPAPDPAAVAAERDDSESNLAIVEGDDLEIDLALKNMSNRTRESYKTELHELCVRLDHLLLQASVSEANNPLDPLQISQAFVDACLDMLQISIKTRLILFKLFEKHVLKQLGHVYSDANRILIETGILPKVPKSLHKKESARTGDGRETQEEEPSAADAHTHAEGNKISLSPSTLATLMAAIRDSHSAAYGGGNNYYFYGNNPGPAIGAQDLAAILTNKQPVVDRQISRSQPQNLLPQILSELLAKANPAAPRSVAQTEEDTINLVAMFFDKILEDENLPALVQSLVCRLQIPILKVALRDKRFLADSEHPARKLINTITQAGIGLDETKPLERDPLYRAVVDGIQLINRQYSLDEGVFNIVLSELEELIRKEKRKASIVENRTKQTEQGKAKINAAKTFAQSALFEKMKDEQLPGPISEFLTNTWLQVLVITYIKEGKDGAHWVENEQLISDLVWLCKCHSDERSIARAQRLKPEILSRIDNGLSVAIDNAETRAARINDIEQILSTLIEGRDEKAVEFRVLSEEQKETLGRHDDGEKSWSEMTALERQQSRYEELSSKFYLEAKDIPVGAWVEYQDEASGKVARCKLSAKIDADTYIFVNRLGFKVLHKTRRQFAYDMQFNKAKILDCTPLFDRVVDGILARFGQAA